MIHEDDLSLVIGWNDAARQAQSRAEQPIRDMPTWTTFFAHLRGEQQWRHFIVHHGPDGQTWLSETQYSPSAIDLDTVMHVTPPATTPDDLPSVEVLRRLTLAETLIGEMRKTQDQPLDEIWQRWQRLFREYDAAGQ